MKTTIRKWNRPAVAFAILGTAGSLVLAAAEMPLSSSGPPAGGPMADRGGQDRSSGRGDGMVLDDQQRQLFRNALQRRQEEFGQLDAQWRSTMAELVKVAVAGNYDEKMAREKAEAVGRIQVEMMLRRCQALSLVAPTLTPQQRAELVAGRTGPMLLAGGAMEPAGQGPALNGSEAEPRRSPQPPADPVREHLFPPDLVMRFQAQIGLTDEQRQALMAEIQEVQPKFEKLERQAQSEIAALAALLKKEQIQLDTALAQSDKLQAVEREMRRTQLGLMIGLKNRLTPEQQARLQEFKEHETPGRAVTPEPPPAIVAKMQQLQAGIQRWQKDGRDPSPLGRAMRDFEPLMKAGQFKEAELVLDAALQLIESRRER